MLIIEMLTLLPPYSDIMVLDVKEHIIKGNLPKVQLWSIKTNQAIERQKQEQRWLDFVFDKCLKIVPRERASAAECREHIKTSLLI